MIEFIDEKYDKVVIYDETDVVTPENYNMETMKSLMSKGGHRERTYSSSIMGFRNRKKGIVKILKNRYGPLEDYETEQFVLNYGIEEKVEEIYEPIYSRFEILDL